MLPTKLTRSKPDLVDRSADDVPGKAARRVIVAAAPRHRR
jgi:hypothetical protein